MSNTLRFTIAEATPREVELALRAQAEAKRRDVLERHERWRKRRAAEVTRPK